eukprot:Colp12_sorted_trinity150504_noHs@23967
MAEVDVYAKAGLPVYLHGEVVKGFGRGGKQLGCPTANFSEDVVEGIPACVGTGIYFGWACLNHKEVHKMVMSIGWNPYYGNEKKSAETHIIHNFEKDFYGEHLSVSILGYIRPEMNFTSLESLIDAINNDIETAKKALDLPQYIVMKEDPKLRIV